MQRARELQGQSMQQDAKVGRPHDNLLGKGFKDASELTSARPRDANHRETSGKVANNHHSMRKATQDEDHTDTTTEDLDESLARALQDQEDRWGAGLQKARHDTWKGRIQNELLELSTSTMAVPGDDNGHPFHYRNHFANLDSGTPK